jgi:hypothetical protein
MESMEEYGKRRNKYSNLMDTTIGEEAEWISEWI